jgi:hypothetical protein
MTGIDVGCAEDRDRAAGTLDEWVLSIAKVRTALWCAGILVALLQAWAFRQEVSPDGISYLDIAQRCAHGNWHSLVNGYWSPLYPLILGLVFRVAKPSAYWESTVAHLANVGIFTCSFLCFEYLLAMIVREHRDQGKERLPLAEWSLWLVGDCLFVCYGLLFNGTAAIHPDLLLAGLIFLAAGFLVRIRAGHASWRTYVLFGAILGISYLDKGVMFPLSFVFLGCCFLSVKSLAKSALRTIVAMVCFAVVASFLIWPLSRAKGRFTFGDTGKIAYAEFIDGATRYVHWEGGPAGVGRPIHPTRQLLANPPVFEFAKPIGGTYPPWYDPSYWYAGIAPAFRLSRQLRGIRYTIEEYAGILPYMGPVLVAFLCLALIAASGRSVRRDVLGQWHLWIPAVAGLGLYALVYVESRLVGPFLLLACVALFASLRFPDTDSARTVERVVSLALAIVLSVGIGWLGARSSFRALSPKPFVDWQVAERLKLTGIQPGDKIAFMGYSLNAYWAHMAGVQIVAEIPMGAASEYWSSSSQVKSKILSDFAAAGAKAVVTDQGPPSTPNEAWEKLGQTGYSVRMLSTVETRRNSNQ